MVKEMVRGLRRLQAGGILLREVRGIRKALERLADVEERRLELEQGPAGPYPMQASEQDDPIRITEVDDQLAGELYDIEMRLLQAKGAPPTEEEVLEAYDAQHKEPDDPRRLAVLEGRERPRRPIS